jgi:hypothetical protein
MALIEIQSILEQADYNKRPYCVSVISVLLGVGSNPRTVERRSGLAKHPE